MKRLDLLKTGIVACISICIIFTGCKKDDDGEEYDTFDLTGVYVAGGNPEASGTSSAMLWTDGIPQILPYSASPHRSWVAENVCVVGSDVYVVGYQYKGGNEVATLWENRSAQVLSAGGTSAGGATWSSAKSVFVSGNYLYVAGITMDWTSNKFIAAYWRNGILQKLTDGTNNAGAYSVYVSGSDVYVAGYEEAQEITVAKLWKNGIAQNLTDGSSPAHASSVFVSGSDVYVAGMAANGAVLWKNGVVQRLSEKGRASSVYVSGNDVYVSGIGNDAAMLWKNGEAQRLKNGAFANSVFVSGDDVYVVGGRKDVPMIWKNGACQKLSEKNSDGEAVAEKGTANSVFVKK